MWRDERSPVGSPRQNGELAESATSSGRCAISPFDHLDRLLRVVDGDVDVHPEDQLAPRDVLHLVDERAIAILGGDPLRSKSENGCVPAEPTRRPFSRATSLT